MSLPTRITHYLLRSRKAFVRKLLRFVPKHLLPLTKLLPLVAKLSHHNLLVLPKIQAPLQPHTEPPMLNAKHCPLVSSLILIRTYHAIVAGEESKLQPDRQPPKRPVTTSTHSIVIGMRIVNQLFEL